MTSSLSHPDWAALDQAHALEDEARAFILSRRDEEAADATSFIVADFEFRFRRETHAAWRYMRGPEVSDRKESEKIRWPFHSIASASWMVLRFDTDCDVPHVTGPVVTTLEEHREIDILQAFFHALDQAGTNSRLVTWGGEARDLAVLRHQACRHDLALPRHLRDTSPYARERIDLCRSTAVQADSVHLDEYAAGSGIPAKPSPPRSIGKLVEAGEWELVRDHNLADVLTTSIIALQWLTAMGELRCDRERSAVAISDAGLAAFPESSFLEREFRPWARDQLRAAGMGGVVYRVEEIA